jgi:GntR family transcriptional regulator, carbon starvation induced regulator
MKISKDGRTLNAVMFEQLREEILTGKLLPGQRLKVSALAEEHGVSLNVVREALNRLAGEQWVDIEPQQGFRVRGLTVDDLVDLVRQRTIFEGIALRQSIARGDLEWQSRVVGAHHRLSRTPVATGPSSERVNPEWLARHEEFNIVMMEACGSPRLVQMVKQLAEAAAMYHRALLPAISDDRELESEHRALLDSILAKDADTAVEVLTCHLEETRDMMLPFLIAKSDGAKPEISNDGERDPTEKRPRGRPRGSSNQRESRDAIDNSISK